VVLDVDGPSPSIRDRNAQVIGATATTKINRKDFGLNWNRTIEAGGVMVGEDVAITVEGELHRKDAASAAK